MSIYLYSFASDGPPNDAGLPLAHLLKPFHEKFGNEVDGAYAFTPSTIPDEFKWCVRDMQKVTGSMQRNAGYANIGLGAWRAFLMHHAVKCNPEIKDGDIVLIHDVNYVKYPNFLKIANIARDFCKRIKAMLENEGGFLYIPMHSEKETISSYCRSCVVSFLLSETTDDDNKLIEFNKLPIGRCFMMVMIVNEKSRAFSKKVLDLCERFQDSILAPGCDNDYKMMLSDGLAVVHHTQTFNYSHHTAEQAVINILAYREYAYTSRISPGFSWMYKIPNGNHTNGYGYDDLINKCPGKKIAFCYFGLTRSIQKIYKSHFKYIYDCLPRESYKIFLHTWEMPGGIQNVNYITIDEKCNLEDYKLLNPDFFQRDSQKEYLDGIDECIETRFKRNSNYPHLNEKRVLQNYFCAMESQKRCAEMVAIATAEDFFDIIVMLRPDVEFTSEFPWGDILLKGKMCDLFVPSFNQFGGECDQLAVILLNNKNVDYTHRINGALEYLENVGHIHPETYLKHSVRDLDIKRLDSLNNFKIVRL